MKSKVLVLMSSYNGEKFIEEQINSILNQKYVDVSILIRDDGSTDSTVNILEKYKKKYKNIDYFVGENKGSAISFMNLIYCCNENIDFYAFADQDDFWMEDKLSSAIEKIEKIKKPALYFSSKSIGDSKLNIILKNDYSNSKNDFESSCIKNIATGCTIVINNNLMQKLKQYKVNDIEMHDYWIYRLCHTIDGYVYYDNVPHIIYRQHGNNVIGFKESMKSKITRRFNSFFKCKHYRKKMSQFLLDGYQNEISVEKRKILEQFSSYDKIMAYKVELFINSSLRTNRFMDNFIFRVALLINRV